MKTKKTIIAVLTAALVTAFIIGCNVPLDDPNLDSGVGEKQSTPDGKTRVRISLGNSNSNSNARTILPDTSAYDAASKFAKFLLFVYDDTGGQYEKLPNSTDSITSIDPSDDATFVFFTYDKFSTDLLLTTDHFYTFTVFACSSSGDFQAWGESDDGANNTSIEINNDGSDLINIKLKEIVSSMPTEWNTFISNGKFSWKVTGLSSYDTAVLSLKKIGGVAFPIGGPNVTSVDLKALGGIGSVSNVPSGYYTMLLQLGGSPKFQTFYVREVIHIWSGLETKYIPGIKPTVPDATAAPLPALKSLLHIVTIDYGDDSSDNDGPASKNAIHGNTISDVLANTTDPDDGTTSINITTPDHSTPADYYFYQWRKTDSAGAVITGSEIIISPITLYAEWLAYKVPAVGHYDITGNTTQPEGSVSGLSVVPKSADGSSYSQGAVTVWYTPDGGGTPTDDPSGLTEGDYDVTFDVAASGTAPNKWKAQTGLSAGTLTVEEALKLFKLTVNWSNPSVTEPTPILDYSGSSFVASSGALVIDVTITNHTNWGKFEWTASHTANTLVSEDTNPLHGYHLLLTLDATTTNGLVWSVPGEFTIKVLLDDTYDAEVKFTPINW